jgi:hypothetical protein
VLELIVDGVKLFVVRLEFLFRRFQLFMVDCSSSLTEVISSFAAFCCSTALSICSMVLSSSERVALSSSSRACRLAASSPRWMRFERRWEI